MQNEITDVGQYTAQNRRAWDEIAEVRQSIFEPAEYFAAGGCRLRDSLLSVVREVSGLTLCHLQCATGEDTLSWANCGAVATGIDISPRQIALAELKAKEAGISVRFLAADLYDLPPSLFDERFDLVFTGGGALVWLPDLARWAQTIVRLLQPGGRLILEEEHPLAGCLEVKNGQINIIDDYFGRKPERYTGWSHFTGAEDAQEPKYEFIWPLGDVVTQLANAGLRIELLEERPNAAGWRFGENPGEVRHLPGSYLLIARRQPES